MIRRNDSVMLDDFLAEVRVLSLKPTSKPEIWTLEAELEGKQYRVGVVGREY